MEEISLREYIEVLLKGKKLIAGITAVAILVAAVLSFTMPSTYEASAVLLANPIGFAPQQTTADGINDIINAMSRYPQMDVATYKEQFINPTILNKTISDLQLQDDQGNPLKRRTLMNKITLETVDRTNLLRVRVQDQNPELAANIANALSQNFISFISEKTKEQGFAAAAAIEIQLKEEEKKLDIQAQRLKEYLMNSKSIEELNSEVSSLIQQITTYKASLNDVNKFIVSDKETLTVLNKGRGTVTGIDPSAIKANISLGTEAGIGEYQVSLGNDRVLQQSIISIRAAEIEARLIQNIAEQDSLTASIVDMTSRLSEVQSMLAEEQYKYNSIQRDYSLAEQAYNGYQQRHKEAIITAASDIGRISIQVSSKAVPPNFPIAPRKALNVAIAAVLGMMISVFIVFFEEYWKNSKTY